MVEGGWFNTKDTKKVTKDTKGPGRGAWDSGRIDACRVMTRTVSLCPS